MDTSCRPQWPGDPNEREPPDRDGRSLDWIIAAVLFFLCAVAGLAFFFWLLRPPSVLPM